MMTPDSSIGPPRPNALGVAKGTDLLITGGPSTGKSQALADRLESLIKAGARPLNVVWVSAAGTQSPYGGSAEASPGSKAPTVLRHTPGTLAHQVLTTFGLPKDAPVTGRYSVWSREQAWQQFVHVARATPQYRHVPAGEIFRICQWHRATRAGISVERPKGPEFNIFTGLSQEYEDRKAGCNALDCDDLVQLAVRALDQNNGIYATAMWINTAPNALLVDDLHALTPMEYELISRRWGRGTAVAVTADPNLPRAGGIPGAPDLAAKFLEDRPRAEVRSLRRSRRHTNPVADLIRKLTDSSAEVPGLTPAFIKGSGEGDGPPAIVSVPEDTESIAEFVRDTAHHLLQERYDWRDMACILLDPSGIDPLRSELTHLGIPCHTSDEDGDLAPHVRKTIDLLTWVYNSRDWRAFTGAAFSSDEARRDPAVNLSVRQIFSRARHGAHPIAAVEEMAAHFAPGDSIPLALTHAVEAYQRLGSMLDADQTSLVEVVSAAIELSEVDPAMDSALDDLLKEAEQFDGAGSGTLHRRLAELLHQLRLERAGRYRQYGHGLAITATSGTGDSYWQAAFVIDNGDGDGDPSGRARDLYAALTRATRSVYFIDATSNRDSPTESQGPRWANVLRRINDRTKSVSADLVPTDREPAEAPTDPDRGSGSSASPRSHLVTRRVTEPHRPVSPASGSGATQATRPPARRTTAGPTPPAASGEAVRRRQRREAVAEHRIPERHRRSSTKNNSRGGPDLPCCGFIAAVLAAVFALAVYALFTFGVL